MEGLKKGNKISEVSRHHDIHSSQFYDWKEKAMLGAKKGLKLRKNGKFKELKRKDEKLNQLKEIVADHKVENELLKKRRLGLSGELHGKRFERETKRELIKIMRSHPNPLLKFIMGKEPQIINLLEVRLDFTP